MKPQLPQAAANAKAPTAPPQPANWPFPSASGPTPWTGAQVKAYRLAQIAQQPEALL